MSRNGKCRARKVYERKTQENYYSRSKIDKQIINGNECSQEKT